MRENEPQMTPRNGDTLVCGIVARISGCRGQKEVSLDDQEAHGQDEAESLYSEQIDYRVIATVGKGERLDRPELAEIEVELRKRELDLLFIEDLGRLIRGGEAVRFLGIAVDSGTRVISPNDGIDTNDPDWEVRALAACQDHVAHNAHTSKRLKQKLMNRFAKGIGAISREPYGYVVPPEAKTFAEWSKDPAAEAYIQDGARRLRENLNCSAVADWFNAEGVPVGPYCRRDSWNGAMVRRLYGNPLLKGCPQRGAKHTVKEYQSGRRVSKRNPKGPKFFSAPHLAYFDPVDFDELEALLRNRNQNKARPKIHRTEDPLLGVSRKRSRFPGQHSKCWYCGREYVWGGNGVSGNLQCKGSREYHCWNSIGFDGAAAAKLLVDAIMLRITQLTDFDDQFRELVAQASSGMRTGLGDQWASLLREEASIAQEKKNFLQAIKSCGNHPMLEEELANISGREADLGRKRRHLEKLKTSPLTLPQSTVELGQMLREEFSRQVIGSYEMASLMRKLVPKFYVYLVRLCDGGHLLSRTSVRVDLGGQLSDTSLVPGLPQLLSCELTLDLFDAPQRERIREEAVRLSEQGLTHKQIAARIQEAPTATAVANAIALHKKMLAMGLSTPYMVAHKPPDDYPKVRRHRHPRYGFQPSEGFVRPAI